MIEILVVIVNLLIGILSVNRLFPPGFLITKRTEEQTRASRLALLEANRLQAASVNLMGAIIPITIVKNGNNVSFAIDAGATPDDVTEAPPEPAGQFPWNYYFSGPNKHRRVIDEQVRIPFPSPLATGRGSIYLLNLGPFMDVAWDGLTRSIFIQGGPMTSIPADSSVSTVPSEDPRLRNQYNYLIDYVNKKIGFRSAPYPREYLLTFGFYDAGGVVETRVDELIAVPANTDAWLTIPNLPVGAGEIVAYSDRVGRKFSEVAPGAWSSNNPYEFYVGSPTIGNLGNVGVIVFNPIGRDFTEQTNVGPQPLTAHIDYDVADWHIIREDRSMPASRPYILPLSLRDLKKVDDVEADQSVYDGLFTGVPKANNVGDIMVYDVTTGNPVPSVDPNTNTQNYYVDYQRGIVTFSDLFGDANRAATFRFFYKAHGDWALMVQKACGLYNRVNTPAVGYCSYWLGDGNNGSYSTRVYFPRSEAGKTVTVREIWYKDASNVTHKLTNKTYRIESNPAQFQAVGAYQLTYFDIAAEFAPGDPVMPAAFDYASTGQPLLGVQGVSLRTRVIWRNGGSVSQQGGANLFPSRWRKVDVDTILARSPVQ
jgi:hypothetical protein